LTKKLPKMFPRPKVLLSIDLKVLYKNSLRIAVERFSGKCFDKSKVIAKNGLRIAVAAKFLIQTRKIIEYFPKMDLELLQDDLIIKKVYKQQIRLRSL
jgi:hypothetical protein